MILQIIIPPSQCHPSQASCELQSVLKLSTSLSITNSFINMIDTRRKQYFVKNRRNKLTEILLRQEKINSKSVERSGKERGFKIDPIIHIYMYSFSSISIPYIYSMRNNVLVFGFFLWRVFLQKIFNKVHFTICYPFTKYWNKVIKSLYYIKKLPKTSRSVVFSMQCKWTASKNSRLRWRTTVLGHPVCMQMQFWAVHW